MRKWVAMLLSITLVFSIFGCSSSEKEKEVEKGRYMEKTIELPKFETEANFFGTTYDSLGRLCFAVSTRATMNSKLTTYTQKENGYEKKEITNLDKYFKDSFNVRGAVLDENGKWYVSLSRKYYVDKGGKEYTEDSIIGKNRTYSIEESKKIDDYTKGMTKYLQYKLCCDGKDITPSSWVAGSMDASGDADGITKVGVSKDGIVVYENIRDGALIKYDPDTKKEDKIVSISYDQGYPWYLTGNNLYVVTKDSNSAKDKTKIEIYDLNTLTSKSIDADVSISKEAQSKLYVDKEETIYIVNKKGIFKHQKNGTLWEEILQANQFSIAGYKETLSDVLVDKEGKISVLTYKENSGRYNLYQYYFDENAVAKPTKKLTVYSLWESGTIREAVRRFQLKNPDVMIEYTVADQDSTDKAQIIQKLNTEILAGKAADIIITDGLNQKFYQEKGVLEDLSDVVDSSKLLGSVAKNYTKNGKMYGVPVKVSVPVVVSEYDMKVALSSMEKLAELCKDKKKPVFNHETSSQLLEKLLYSYGNELFTEDGTLDKGKLSSYLEQARTIINHSETKDFMNINNREQVACWADTVYADDGKSYVNIPTKILNGSALFLHEASPADICLYETYRQDTKAYYTTINNGFISSGRVSINANGNMKKEAKELVKYLFTDEMQELDCGDGYPVTKTALLKWKSSYKAIKTVVAGFDQDSNILMYPVPSPDDTTRKIAIDMVEQAKQPIYQDVTIVNLIKSESDKYIHGQSDLNTTVNTIIQKVDRYLEEQK